MKTIHKYPIEITDYQEVILPMGAKILTAQFQGEQLCLWALVDTDKPFAHRSIWTFGTGKEMLSERKTYIATVQQGPFVWHIFD